MKKTTLLKRKDVAGFSPSGHMAYFFVDGKLFKGRIKGSGHGSSNIRVPDQSYRLITYTIKPVKESLLNIKDNYI